MRSRKFFLFMLVLAILPVGIFYTTFADDHGDKQRQRNRNRERHRDDDHGRSYLKPVNDPTYKDNCGGCHFAYQPELLPSASWKRILDGLDDHFGESFELDQQTKKVVLGYLETNAAEHSTAKRAVKIMRSLRGQVPTRITETPYIREKHHEISASTINRQAIGSLSNCVACHGKAEEGIYDDDYVVIPN